MNQVTSAESNKVSVSAVVPVYAGEAYLERLVAEIGKVRDDWNATGAPLELAELIFVDDCGTPASGVLVDQLAAAHHWVTGLHLARNSGQHPATIAGILYTSGDWVVTLDEDLQHPPEKIPELLKSAMLSKSDIVYAQAESGVHEAYSRDVGSRTAKRLIAWLSGNKDVVHFNSFRLIRGSVARAAASVCSHDTYFDVVLTWYTQRIHAVAMRLKDERFIQTRKSGYRIRTLISHARRLVFTSQMKVLRLGALSGLAVIALAGIAALTVLTTKVLHPESIALMGWTSLILAISFFGGLSALMLGLLMEYVSALVLRAHGKPLFFVIDRSSDDVLIDYFKAQEG